MITLHTNHGDIVLELDFAKAPLTAANFLQYAQDGHYDGTVFHRVISNFMIQGGGFEPGLKQKKARAPVQNEADNGLRNDIGSIAMARTSDPHSASCQFFINVAPNDFLNFRSKTPQGWGYCVFGRVTDGMDVVNQIKAVPTGNKQGHGDVPIDDVVITSVSIDSSKLPA
jgi:peptidyl-prolyl cis-trans isomerase B (cyclophilin B)